MVQLLCECWLVLAGPGLGELAGGEVAVGAVGSVGVVVDAPVLDEDLGFEQGVKGPAVRNSSRSRPLKDSIQAFCQGESGSMKTLSTWLNRHQSATAAAMNSSPLSKRTKPGALPRSTARRSRVATTRSASMCRSTTMAGHSRVYSSTMFNSLRVRPSAVTSNWKSSAHRALGRSVLASHLAGPTLGDPEPLTHHPDSAAATVRGQKLAEVLLRSDNSLSRGECELIAAYVSNLNRCHFCASSHSTFAAMQLEGSETLADAAGATDVEIHDTVLIAAALCTYNRYVDGLATWAPAGREAYREMAHLIMENGYVGAGTSLDEST